MRRYLLLIFLALFSFSAIHAEITWTLSDDGTLTISGTSMPDYDLIDNYPYLSRCFQDFSKPDYDLTYEDNDFGSSAPWFSQREKIKKVVIENGMKNIGNYAFSYCWGITSITIPNSVTSIGWHAFYGTKWAKNRPYGMDYLGRVLYRFNGEMPANTKITVKEGTAQICDFAFYGCNNLVSITIPNSVTSIGAYAFNGCSCLISVTIPNSVKSIGGKVFANCRGLTSVAIPNSITSIGGSAFYGCNNLTSITIPNSVTTIEARTFYGCNNLVSITIPNSVTTSDYRAFKECIGLISVIIGNSVTSIRDYAFDKCVGLTSVTIPNFVTNIGHCAFRGCSSLTSVTFEGSTPPVFGEDVFEGVNKSIPVYVPANSIEVYKKALKRYFKKASIQAL